MSSIGLSEEQAKEQGIEYITSKYQFSGNGKALTMGDAEGMVKVIAAKDKSRLLGVHIIGPNASDLIAEAAIAMNGMLQWRRQPVSCTGIPRSQRPLTRRYPISWEKPFTCRR